MAIASTSQTSMPQTLYDKLWSSHMVKSLEGGNDLLYIDRHLVHEVTSPQAFEGLTAAKRGLWRKQSILAVPDHNVPTTIAERKNVTDLISLKQLQRLDHNAKAFKLNYIPLNDVRQGIVHVIGPEQGLIQPGISIVCGDSHTATHGALAALSFGIGTSEVEKVFATQCLILKKNKNFLVSYINTLPKYVFAKDMILSLIRLIGTKGATGYTLEYTGEAITELSIEERMTVCNMSIESGARSGLIGVDDKTIEYVLNRPLSPKGEYIDQAINYWKQFTSDKSAVFDRSVEIDCSTMEPMVTWGTSPEMGINISETIPSIDTAPHRRDSYQKSYEYMGLHENQKLEEIKFDKVFIGSCTNSRISDLKLAAEFLQKTKKKIHPNISLAMVVPGSGLVKKQAEELGLDKIFKASGFQWREPGCSMCLGMNQDILSPGERCASTSNRNFEGRQGRGGRTHLMSPVTACAVAIAGTIVHPNELI